MLLILYEVWTWKNSAPSKLKCKRTNDFKPTLPASLTISDSKTLHLLRPCQWSCYFYIKIKIFKDSGSSKLKIKRKIQILLGIKSNFLKSNRKRSWISTAHNKLIPKLFLSKTLSVILSILKQNQDIQWY